MNTEKKEFDEKYKQFRVAINEKIHDATFDLDTGYHFSVGVYDDNGEYQHKSISIEVSGFLLSGGGINIIQYGSMPRDTWSKTQNLWALHPNEVLEILTDKMLESIFKEIEHQKQWVRDNAKKKTPIVNKLLEKWGQ